MRLITNADDLGASREINEAIFDLMSKGLVTSATLLANGEAFNEAVAGAKHFPQCSFGVHLNASQWAPLTSDAGLGPILYENGDFADNRLREIPVDGKLRAALFREWSAQVHRVRSAGLQVSHFDSHHHMHTVPSVFPVLKAVQKRFGIRKVRLSRNVYDGADPVRKSLLVRKAVWNATLRTWYKTKTTNLFTSLETFHRAFHTLPAQVNTAELMVHPGPYASPHEDELLRREWWLDFPVRVEFISYNQL